MSSLRLIFIFLLALALDLEVKAEEKDIAFDAFTLHLSTNQSGALINITGKEGSLKTHAEIVASPQRFFIDILGVQSKSARSVELTSAIIKKVRVGIHKDKTRIVFDLAEGVSDLSFTDKDLSDVNTGKYLYEFNLKGTQEFKETLQINSPSPVPTTSEKEVKPSLVSTPNPTINIPIQTPIPSPSIIEVKPKPSSTPIETKKVEEISKDEIDLKEEYKVPETQAPTSTPTPPPSIPTAVLPSTNLEKLPTPSPTKASSRSEIEQAVLDISSSTLSRSIVLKNLVFQTTSDNIQSSIGISLSEIKDYSLKQETPTKYILSLPSTRLRASHLNLPQYPPDSFKGYVYINAEETREGVDVIIVVDPGVKLLAEVFQGKLWVKTQ